ncbi:hypothetical protein [Gracilibacillus lacisalsi]|uniref:hypothetical protein n=1 Tax=Gracilibacillus lacisalsi TaxID=393087 RepID=UPI00036A5FE9|nr:hypothetical protein [Gracilibacillus lacisalsi]
MESGQYSRVRKFESKKSTAIVHQEYMMVIRQGVARSIGKIDRGMQTNQILIS